MLHLKPVGLVGELGPVDGRAARAVAVFVVAALQHEALDDAVEQRALVRHALALGVGARVAAAQREEVGHRLGRLLRQQFHEDHRGIVIEDDCWIGSTDDPTDDAGLARRLAYGFRRRQRRQV